MSYAIIKENLEALKTKELTDETKNEIVDYLINIVGLLESNDQFHSKIVETLQGQAESISLISEALRG